MPMDPAPKTPSKVNDSNRIHFYGEINEDSAQEFLIEFRKREDVLLAHAVVNRCEPNPIHIHLHSSGGSVTHGLAMADAIRASRVPVCVYAEGMVASAATYPFVVAHKRFIYKNAFILLHQVSTSFVGKHEEYLDEKQNLDKLNKVIENLYLSYTKITGKKLGEVMRNERWFDSAEAKKLGLVDEIL